MASYSNSPNVSGNIFNQLNDSPDISWTAVGGFGKYKLLYTVPANSYAIINLSIQAVGMVSSSDRVGLVFSLPASYSSGFSILEVSQSNSYNSKNDIYIGPGMNVYLLTNYAPTTTLSVAATLSGVQLTNGA